MMPTANLAFFLVITPLLKTSYYFSVPFSHWYQILGYSFHLEQFEVHHTADLPFPQFPEDVGLK